MGENCLLLLLLLFKKKKKINPLETLDFFKYLYFPLVWALQPEFFASVINVLRSLPTRFSAADPSTWYVIASKSYKLSSFSLYYFIFLTESSKAGVESSCDVLQFFSIVIL